MLKDRDWWRHTLYYRSHLPPNQEGVGEEYEVGTGSDRNRKWSKPEVIETGSDRNRKWSANSAGWGGDREDGGGEECEVFNKIK